MQRGNFPSEDNRRVGGQLWLAQLAVKSLHGQARNARKVG